MHTDTLPASTGVTLQQSAAAAMNVQGILFIPLHTTCTLFPAACRWPRPALTVDTVIGREVNAVLLHL